jgi:N-acetylmuramoyl-L-alanine amidase
MKTVFLSAGHSQNPKRDRGAAGNNYIEGELTVEQRNLISKYLKKLGVNVSVDADDSILADTIRFFKNKTSKDSIVVDLHWNAATPKATGVEVLIPENPTKTEINIATDITKTISETLGIKNRGVKTEAQSHHGRLGFMRLIGENILIETCFISNKTDMESYQKNKEVLAEKIANILASYAFDYIVKAGDTLSKIAKEKNTTVEKIKKENNLTSDLIQVGQKLKI